MLGQGKKRRLIMVRSYDSILYLEEQLINELLKIQTCKRFKRTLFIGIKHDLQIFGVILLSYKTKLEQRLEVV